MNLSIRAGWLKKLHKAGGSRIEDFWHRHDENSAEIDIERFEASDLKLLLTICEDELKDANGLHRLARSTKSKIATFNKLSTDPTCRPIGKLEALETALKAYIGKSRHKMLFVDMPDGTSAPFYVVSVKYNAAHKYSPAHTSISLIANRQGEKNEKSLTWHQHELGKNVVELLAAEDAMLETPESYVEYEKHLALYNKYAGMTGEQFLATGQGTCTGNSRYDTEVQSMVRDGVSAKVVMDDETNSEESGKRSLKSVIAPNSFWTDKRKRDTEDDEEVADGSILAPVQPYVNVFDLAKHRFVDIHISNLEPYTYDTALINKLVLPKAKKELINALVADAGEQLDDIISGKTGGTIIIETGPSGTGKTLTAEVYSEVIKRPLYCVQCSQLGINEKELEKELDTVLSRATRWKAILLVDEADVYIHARGNDIRQNAIVGVWLQVLEYYRGVLFMTSNREVIIDDAILSRATAWIRYNMPNQTELASIWKILSEQYRVKLTDAQIHELVQHEKLKSISGRNVKSLLKLVRPLAKHRTMPVNVDLFVYVADFLDLESSEQKRDFSNRQATEILPED
jgi:hypothetical protein